MKKITTSLGAVLVALSLVVAGCGSDDTGRPVVSGDPGRSSGDAGMTEPATIVDVASRAGSFEILVAAVKAAGLVEALTGEGPLTVFAPTDDAFAAALELLDMTAEELLADIDLLTSILTYHVIPGTVTASQVLELDGESIVTLNGAPVDISVVDGTVMIADATVIKPDVGASNGVIHVIDSVLLPPS